MINGKGRRFDKAMLLRWRLAYPLRARNREEMRAERGVQQLTPWQEARFRRGKEHPVDSRGRMDETHLKSKGPWKYRYRAADKAGQPIDIIIIKKFPVGFIFPMEDGLAKRNPPKPQPNRRVTG